MSFQGQERDYFCLYYISSYKASYPRALRLEGRDHVEYRTYAHRFLGFRTAPGAPLELELTPAKNLKLLWHLNGFRLAWPEPARGKVVKLDVLIIPFFYLLLSLFSLSQLPLGIVRSYCLQLNV